MAYDVVDLSGAEQAEMLTGLLREASTLTSPREVLGHFSQYFRKKRYSDLFYSLSRRGLPAGKFKITRRIVGKEFGTKGPELANPWRDWAKMPEHEGGFFAGVLERGMPQLLTNMRIENDPVVGDDLARMRSCMAIANYDDGEPLNWAFWFYESEEPPTIEHFETTILDTNMLGMATRNLVNKLEAERLAGQLREQFEKIAMIQRSLLPRATPDIPGSEIATSYLTSEEAGGDYFDFFQHSGGKWGILIADVAGHGPAAATVMAMLRGILHCYEQPDPCPGAVMDFANEKLIGAHLNGSFVTAYFGVFDPATGELKSALCGHNPPRIRRASGEIECIDEGGGLPLGVDEDLMLEPTASVLRPGDTLVLYTDGVTESFNSEREMMGVEAMDRAIAAAVDEPQAIIDAIYGAVFAHTGRMDRDDDQTLVLLRYGGAS